jgi:DNA-binding NarL/FixJ family response regulator
MRGYYENNKDRIQKYHRQYMRDYNKNSKSIVYACNKRCTDRAKRSMWTAEEEVTLLELQAEGLTIPEIAVALGRSRDSVQSKIGRVHRKQRMESINELHDLIELYHINSSLGED